MKLRRKRTRNGGRKRGRKEMKKNGRGRDGRMKRWKK